MKIIRLLALLCTAILWPAASALAQSGCPTIINGAVLTAAQWNACFAAKQNLLGYIPVNKAGDVMLGSFGTVASTTLKAGINIPPGTAPTSPINGDFWSTSTGFFGRVNGTTVGPFTNATGGSFSATLPLVVTFPSSVVNYALNFNTSLVNTAGSLGINLAHSNIFSAAQTVSLNAGTLPTALTNSVLRIAGVDATTARISVEGYGGLAAFSTARAAGTAAAPTQILSGTEIGGFNAFAWGSNAAFNGPIASFRTYSAENITATAWGSKACVATTPVTTATLTDGLCQNNDGGVTIASPTGGSKGAGTLNLTGLYINNVAVTSAGITALTGDVTATGPGSVGATVVNLPTGVTVAGNLLYSNIAAPSTPASTKVIVWTDSTDLRFHDKNSAGSIGTTVVSSTTVTNQFLTGITTAGVITRAQPAFTDISGQATLLQLPSMATNTVLTNATSGTATPTAFAVSSCDTATKALQWTTNTGFVCNSAINAATLGGATFAAPGTIGGGTPGLITGTTITANTAIVAAIHRPASDSTTAIQITKADGTTRVMDFDTTNARVGINKTPGAFDLDVNGNVNFGGTLTSSIQANGLMGNPTGSTAASTTFTIPSLTLKASPVSGDLVMIADSAASNGIRYTTVGAIASAGSVASVNAATGAVYIAMNQGRLTRSSTTALLFAPYNGDKIMIAGVMYAIPTGGIAGCTNTSAFVNGAGSSSLSAGTAYLVTAFVNSGAVTCDFLTTLTHTQSTTAANIGVEIPTGDNTRTVIGMVYTNGSSQFQADNTLWGVISWFNQTDISIVNAFTVSRSTTSASYAELNTEIRGNFVTWGSSVVTVSVGGACFNTTANQACTASVGFDGLTAEDAYIENFMSTGSNQINSAFTLQKYNIAQGFHYATLLGKASASTATWLGSGTAGTRTSLAVRIRG